MKKILFCAGALTNFLLAAEPVAATAARTTTATASTLSDQIDPETTALCRATLPWINSALYNVPMPKDALYPAGSTVALNVYSALVYDIQNHLGALERILPRSDAIPYTGIWTLYDRAQEAVLCRLAREYATRPSLKSADIGCGPGRFSRYMRYVGDGTKDMTICCVDGNQVCIDGFFSVTHPKTEETIGFIPKVSYQKMCKPIQGLPSTNFFGPKNYGTFDFLICLNVFHLMSYNEKQAALKHFCDLLKPGGILMFSHTSKNFQCFFGGFDLSPPGIYSYPLKFGKDGIRITDVISAQETTCQLPFGAVSTQSSLDEVPAWKDRSPQDYWLDGGIIPRGGSAVLKALAEKDVTTLTAVLEVVTHETLQDKCRKAGFEVENILPHNFDTPWDTKFGRSIDEGRNHSGAISYLVTARKPVECPAAVTSAISAATSAASSPPSTKLD